MSELTRTELLRLFHYDPATGAMTYRFAGRNIKAGAALGAKKTDKDGKTYYQCRIAKRHYFVHRVIWFYMTGEWPVRIDHADGNGTNNAWANLSSVTTAQNARNIRKKSTNKSGHTGVRWCPKAKRWTATIVHNRKHKWLGSFALLSDAVAVRKSAERDFGFHPNHGQERPL